MWGFEELWGKASFSFLTTNRSPGRGVVTRPRHIAEDSGDPAPWSASRLGAHVLQRPGPAPAPLGPLCPRAAVPRTTPHLSLSTSLAALCLVLQARLDYGGLEFAHLRGKHPGVPDRRLLGVHVLGPVLRRAWGHRGRHGHRVLPLPHRT